MAVAPGKTETPHWLIGRLHVKGLESSGWFKPSVLEARSDVTAAGSSLSSIGDQLAAQSAPNLTRVDDVLLRIGMSGMALSVLAGYVQWKHSLWPQTLASGLTVFAFSGSVMLLVLALVVRRRESTSWQLLQLMRHNPDMQISTLVSNSRFSLSDLQRGVEAINSAGLAHLVLDEKQDRLYDGRLSAHLTIAHHCENCGADSELTVNVQDQAPAVCSYCLSPVPVSAINSLRRSQLQSVVIQNHTAHQVQQASRELIIPEPTLSIKLLLGLAVLFWPAAAFYAGKYLLAVIKHNSRLAALTARNKASLANHTHQNG